MHWAEAVGVDLPLNLEGLLKVAHPALGIEERHCQAIALQPLAQRPQLLRAYERGKVGQSISWNEAKEGAREMG